MVSTSPRRTVAVRPRCRLTSASAWLAPVLCASLSALATTSFSSPSLEASTCCAIPGFSLLHCGRACLKAPRPALCHDFTSDCNSAPSRPLQRLKEPHLSKHRTSAGQAPAPAGAAERSDEEAGDELDDAL